ncbi:DUF3103 family protein [Fibrella sp. WM1]|uniref:DUF3103 family protein n=1 Tax=Fibrella musci TaxID=3242485 RepID=UPI00352003B0
MRKILIAAVLVPLGMLWGCQDRVDSALPVTPQVAEYVEGSAGETYDPVLEEFAKTLAASMTDISMREFVHTEAARAFDGDQDILVQQVGNKAFEKTLVRANSERARSGARTTAFSLREYTAKRPLLNVAVPVHNDEWQPTMYTPLVAVSPTINDEYRVKYIKAFDSKGNVHWLSTRGVPDKPVVVVGLNERVRMDATGQMKLKANLVSLQKSGKRPTGQPAMMNIEQLPDDGTGGGGTGGGGTGGTCHFQDNALLQIPRLEVNNIEPFETWDRGMPEICLESYGINPTTNTERKFRRFIWLGQNNAFRQPGPWSGFGYSPYQSFDVNNIETWNTSLFGSELAFKFWEEDSGGTDASASLKLGLITITVNLGAGDDEIGDLWLYRCGDNQIYQNNGQNFKQLQSRNSNFWIFFRTV